MFLRSFSEAACRTSFCFHPTIEATQLEASELFFEAADSNEIKSRVHDAVFVTRFEVAVG